MKECQQKTANARNFEIKLYSTKMKTCGAEGAQRRELGVAVGRKEGSINTYRKTLQLRSPAEAKRNIISN
jgi:hypothetical protein